MSRAEARRTDGEHAFEPLYPPTDVSLRPDLDELLVVIGVDDHQTRAGDGALQARRGNLDTERGLDLLVVLVGRLDPELAQRLRRKQRADLRHNRAIQAGHADAVALVERAVHQHDVDRRALTLDHLDLEEGQDKTTNKHRE